MSGHKTTHNQTERYRYIDKILSEGKSTSFEKLREKIRDEFEDKKFSDSSLRRDLRYMKESLDAPIVFDRKKGGYLYEKPFNFPIQGISQDDIFILALIKKFLKKYDDANPLYNRSATFIAKHFPSVEKTESKIEDRFVISKGPKPIIDNEVFEKILEALKNNLELSFVYRSKWEPLKNHRIVKPCQLIVDNGHIFLYAASSKNGILTRLYNLNRIQEVQILTTRTFELPPDYKFEEDFEKGRWGAFQYDESYEFKIAVYGDSRNTLYESVWADDQVLESFPNEEKIVISFTSSQWIPIQKWLLSFGADAEPLEPDWLVDWWKTETEKMYKKSIKMGK